MLLIHVPAQKKQYWNDDTEQFVYYSVEEDVTLELEHSLRAISRFEEHFHERYFDFNNPKVIPMKEFTDEHLFYYFKCMTMNGPFPDDVYRCFTQENYKDIVTYMNDSHTATIIHDDDTKSPNNELTSSELIYYWMCSSQIPWEAQDWHINRLLTLIHIFGIKNGDHKKKSVKDTAMDYRALNEKRMAEAKRKAKKG